MAARGAGPKQTNDPWPEEQGGAVQGGGAPAAQACLLGRDPGDALGGDRGKEGPPGRRFPAPRLPTPGRLERDEKSCPTTGRVGGGQAASASSPTAV